MKKRKAIDGKTFDAHTMQLRNGHIEKDTETGRLFRIELIPVDRLLKLSLITIEGHTAALDIISLREVALSCVDVARMRYSREWGIVASEMDPLTIYARIMRKLKPYESHLVERFCFQPVREPDYAWAGHCRMSVQESFDGLAKAIDEIRNAAKLVTEECIRTPRIYQ